MAGEIVGRLFPGYFLYNLILSILALILFIIPWSERAKKRFSVSFLCLVIAVLINATVYFKLYPEIKVIKKEIISFDTVASDDPLRQKFGRLHGVSIVLNFLLLADGVTLLVINTAKK
jgi:hypothetical protein